MSERYDTIKSNMVLRADVDRAIRRAHQLRADETARMARAIGRRVRAMFGS